MCRVISQPLMVLSLNDKVFNNEDYVSHNVTLVVKCLKGSVLFNERDEEVTDGELMCTFGKWSNKFTCEKGK